MESNQLKLEVGKRYVLRNGAVTRPLLHNDGFRYGYYDSVSKYSWTSLGQYDIDCAADPRDIVSEYIEPQPDPQPDPQSEPLRWVENCKPDKPGIWARKVNGKDSIGIWNFTQDEIDKGNLDHATRCYIGPIPDILPPKKKVVQRLWMSPVTNDTPNGRALYEGQWIAETTITPAHWIRTERTREVEQ